MNKIYQLSDEDFTLLIQNSTSYLQCVLAVGYSKNGRYAYDLIKQRCKELGISTDHFKGNNGNGYHPKYSLDEILVKDSNYLNLSSLKNRLLKEGLIKYKCDICGNDGSWNGQELSLQLDHINGDHNDNRLENLRLLCPNCHSQTETFSKKRKVV